MSKKSSAVFVPADIPENNVDMFIENYKTITKNTDHLLLFSVDQKIEHLNNDFYGPDIAPEDNDPEHLFRIASEGQIGVMATQLGLIARYAKQYKNINYIVKLNSKTNIIATEYADPLSKELWSVEQVVRFKKQTKLPILGVGYTVYLGSQYEAEMLTQAAQVVYEAHQHGLVAILWMYPRGECLEGYEREGNLIAGAAGVANTLGADFAKVNPPEPSEDKTSEQWLKIAAQAAGNTKLLCSGGTSINPQDFLDRLYAQIHEGNVSGAAVGRNIHQKPLTKAIAFTKALRAIIYEEKTPQEAKKLLM